MIRDRPALIPKGRSAFARVRPNHIWGGVSMMGFLKILGTRGTARTREAPPLAADIRREGAALSVMIDVPPGDATPRAVNPPSRRGSPIPHTSVVPSSVVPDVPPPFR